MSFVPVANRRGLGAENDLRHGGSWRREERGRKRQKRASNAILGLEMALEWLRKAHFCNLREGYSGLDPMEDTERRALPARQRSPVRLQWARSDGGY